MDGIWLHHDAIVYVLMLMQLLLLLMLMMMIMVVLLMRLLPLLRILKIEPQQYSTVLEAWHLFTKAFYIEYCTT